MFVLDPDVVSELRKGKAGQADRHVAAWASGVPAEVLFVSAITILELATGVLLVRHHDPRQGAMLRVWLDHHVLPAFSGRVQPVETAVAQRSAALHVPDPRSVRDVLIAAIAMVHNMTVVTRNGADVAATGVALLNPWDPAVPPLRRKVPRPRG